MMDVFQELERKPDDMRKFTRHAVIYSAEERTFILTTLKNFRSTFLIKINVQNSVIL